MTQRMPSSGGNFLDSFAQNGVGTSRSANHQSSQSRTSDDPPQTRAPIDSTQRRSAKRPSPVKDPFHFDKSDETDDSEVKWLFWT